jgi:hypothetical protein
MANRCSLYQDQFPDLINQHLIQTDYDAIMAHVSRCPQCKQELEAMQAFAATLKRTEVGSVALKTDQPGWRQLVSGLTIPEPDPALISFLYEPLPPAPLRSLHGYGALLKMQFRFLRRNLSLWLLPMLSFLIILALFGFCRGFSLRYPQTVSILTHGLAFLAPLAGGLCIAFLFSPEESGTVCIGRATNTPPALLLSLRLLVGYGYSLLVTLLGTLLCLPFIPGLSLSWIVVELLIPLTFLASLCLLAAVLANSWIAVCCISLCWCFRVTSSMSPTFWPASRYESFWHRPEILLPFAIVMCLVALLAFQRRGEMLLSSPYRIDLSQRRSTC